MKRLMALLFLIIFSVGFGKTNSKENESNSKIKTVTVTTSFLQDMVKQLAPGKVNLELIIPAGEDPHMYITKPGDQQKIKKADLLLYHGLHFEGKMQKILERKGYAVTSTFSKEKIGKIESNGVVEIDPHFWFDIDLYKEAVRNVGLQLEKLLPEDKDEIEKNTKDYIEKLTKLDEENKVIISQIPKEKRILVTPHDAFNYFARKYDIVIVAPQGVSTDSEVANKDIENTVNFIVKNKVKAIFAESTTDPARMEKLREIARAKGFEVKVVEGQGQELYSDSLAQEGMVGDNYIDMYRHNIKLITENLK